MDTNKEKCDINMKSEGAGVQSINLTSRSKSASNTDSRSNTSAGEISKYYPSLVWQTKKRKPCSVEQPSLAALMKRWDILEDISRCTSTQESYIFPMVMKPALPEERLQIYQGVSHNGEGRAKYLKGRGRTSPEDRWNFPICSSMEVGWSWGTSTQYIYPQYGRRMTMQRLFYRRNGNAKIIL